MHKYIWRMFFAVYKVLWRSFAYMRLGGCAKAIIFIFSISSSCFGLGLGLSSLFPFSRLFNTRFRRFLKLNELVFEFRGSLKTWISWLGIRNLDILDFGAGCLYSTRVWRERLFIERELISARAASDPDSAIKDIRRPEVWVRWETAERETWSGINIAKGSTWTVFREKGFRPLFVVDSSSSESSQSRTQSRLFGPPACIC